MRTKVTIALLLLNAALFYYIFYVREHRVSGMDTTTILGAEASNIQAFSITTPSAANDTVTLVRRGDNWVITAPDEWPANAFAVRPILADLQRLHSETSFTVEDLAKNGQTLADYGLDNPSRILTFTPSAAPGATAAPIVLKIGAHTKVGNRLYILSPDGQRVHIVLRSLAESLSAGLDTLRSDKLFTIAVFEARSLNIEPANGTRVRFRRDNANWALEAPIQARADKINTEVTIKSLEGLRVDRFLATADVPESVRAALASPALRVTLEGNNRTETLLVGSRVETPAPAPDTTPAAKQETAEPGAEFYAQLDNKKTLFTVRIPDRLIKTLRNAQQDLRARNILDLADKTITGITIAAAPQSEVSLQCLDTSAGNTINAPWQIVRHSVGAGPQTMPADHDIIARLLSRLAGLRVLEDKTEEKGFVNDAPSNAELEDYGFTARPDRKITIAFTPVSGVSSLTLEIGVGKDRGVYARVSSQPYIYRVSPDILDDLPANALAYRDHLLRELPAVAQITALKLIDLATQKVLLETVFPVPADSTALNAGQRAAVETLAAQLRTLRAKNFVSDDFERMVFVAGEERPWAYRIEATITRAAEAQTTTAELFIAPRTGGVTQYAGSPQYNVVFEAEQPLIDALQVLTYGPRDPGPPKPAAAQ